MGLANGLILSFAIIGLGGAGIAGFLIWLMKRDSDAGYLNPDDGSLAMAGEKKHANFPGRSRFLSMTASGLVPRPGQSFGVWRLRRVKGSLRRTKAGY